MYFENNGQPTPACSSLSGSCDLVDSHGCIHIAPSLIDYLVDHGWVRTGTIAVVHSYNEAAPAYVQSLLAELPAIDAAHGTQTERDANCGG